MTHRRITRLATATLMGGASLMTLSATAHAQSVLFSTSNELSAGTRLETGREVSIARGTVQVRLPGGAVASFVDSAQFSLRDDGSVDLRSGSVTVVGASGATTAVHMPEGVRGSVAGTSAATFTTNATGSRGSTTAGSVSVISNGVTKSFSAGQFWTAGANRAPDRIIAGSVAAVPGAETRGSVQPMAEGGIVAAAANGIPVALGEGLAGVGARGDVVAAARRIEAYDANPTIAAFPTGDYTLLVRYAAEANGLLGNGGTSFRGAGADIIRTYFEYLAAGNAGGNFRTAYAQVLLNYLDLLRSGVLPSTFRGATQTQLNAYLAFIGRTDGFGTLSANNRQLLDAYLAFLSTNGSPDAFGVSVTNLTTSFLNFVRGGGNPASFTQASATVVSQYLAIVQSGGLRTNLTAQNQALLTAYLANNGIGFTTTYATGLAAFVAYLNTGGLPSNYTVISATTLRSYLETLETTGLFETVLGTQSAFLRSYLTFLRGGGTADQFNALPINIARVNASNLSIYVDYLLAGGAPTAYTVLTQAQIRAALDQLTATGQFTTLLGVNAAFLSEYYAYIRTGADADTFAGLPSVDVNAYAVSLTAFAAYLRAGNLPSGYAALTAQQIRSYLTALQVGNRLALLGSNQTLLAEYLTYIRGGGAPDAFGGLPIVTYNSYATALTAYFAYLNAGGLPSSYTALTQAQLRTYLDVLRANGQFTLLGSNATFYTNYLTYLAGGGAVDAFSGLPIVTFQDYATALSAYFAYLNAGGLPSGYTVLTQGQVRQYLDALSANAQLTALLGGNAAFFTQYRAYLLTGASVDAFAGLPIVTYQSYAVALNAYYAFLVGGGSPSAYTALSQAQIRSYLDALKVAGQVNALLGANSAFFTQYLAFLETGGAANAYPGLPSSTYGQYATALSAYFTYLNAGGLPSGYTALTQAQIREYLSVLQANNQLTALLGGNATFFANYLTFVSGGGSADAFTGLPIVTYTNYASALSAYYAFLVGGGLPANYTALSQAQIRQYLDALTAAGQVNALLGSNAMFFANYLTYVAGGGVPNSFPGLPSTTYGSYATALTAYFAYLNGGGLPSGYTALTQAQIREYLNILQANNQLVALLGTNATFFANYLTFVSGGGSADAFTGLPIVTYQSYAVALNAYYTFLAGGGLPANYTALTQAQIRSYLDALAAANQITALLGANATFFTSYQVYLAGGGAPNGFSGLPSTTYAQYGTSLQAFVAFLRGNGLPGSYTALTSAQIREYLAVLQTNGQLGLIGSSADQQLLSAYATYLASGGLPNQFTGLPAFVTYEAGLRAYYAFLQGGGKPSAYTALTQAQVVAYIQALDAGGLITAKLTATEARFLRDYAVYVSAGSNPDQFAGLPGNQPIGVPVVTQGLASAPRSSDTRTVAIAAAGNAVLGGGATDGRIVIEGDNVKSATSSRSLGVTAGTAKTLEARTVDGTIAIARLGDGTYQTGGSTYTANANQGVHLVWGTPATALPNGSGILTYGLVSATSPTADPNAQVAPGTFTGNFALNVASRTVGFDSVVAIGNQNYVMKSTGGITAPSVGLRDDFTFQVSNLTVAGASTGVVLGFLAGANGAYAGLSYQLQSTIYNQVSGAAIFGLGAPAVPLPTLITANLPAPTYAYASGLPTQGLYVRSVQPTGTTTVSSGLDFRVGTTVTNDANGGLRQTGTGAAVQDIVRGTAKVVDIAGDARAVIGRWTEGTYTRGGTATNTLTAAQGLHYVELAPVSFVMPTSGQINYSLLAATQPTYASGITGAGLFDARLSLLFGSAVKVAMEGTIRMPEPSGTVTYAFATPGGIAGVASRDGQTFSNNVIAITAPITGTGLACTTGCTLNFSGGFGGTADFNRIGAVYSTSDVRGNAGPQIQGAAIFTGTAVAPALDSLPAPTYPYAVGLATGSLYVRSVSPTTTGSVTTNQAGASVTRDAAGGLLTSSNASTQDITRLTAKVTDIFGDSRIAIGRWYDGTYRVGPTNNAAGTLSATQSLHYLQMAPGSFAIPTSGQVNYSLLAATQPTYNTGVTGVGLFDGKMALAFGSTTKIALEGTIRMPEPSGTASYAFATAGGVAGVNALTGQTISGNQFNLSAPMTGSGLACTTSCAINVTGGFGGSDVNRIGLFYFTADARGSAAPSIQGAAIFTGTPVDTSSVIVPAPTRAAFTYAGGFSGPNHAYLVGDSDAAPRTFNTSGGSVVLNGTIETNGGVTSFGGGAIGTYSRGTGRQVDQAGDATVLIGRWYGGTQTSGNVARDFGANDSLHYALIAPGTLTMPTTGTVQYSLIGATQPTMYGAGTTTPAGQVGWGFFEGKMGVTFGTAPKVGIEGAIYMPETAAGSTKYSFSTGGGAAAPGFTIANVGRFLGGGVDMDAPLTGSGLACPSGATTCRISFIGEMGGANASRIGVTYQTLNSTNANSVSGAAAFAAGAAGGGTGGFTGTATGQITYAYASSALNDQGVTTATYDNNVIKGYQSFLTSKAQTAGLVQESGRLADVIGWARWTGDTAGPLTNQGTNTGLHVLSGTPTTMSTLPTTGTAQYTIVGGTKPTIGTISTPALVGVAPGTITGTLGVAYGATARVGIDITAEVGGYGWRVQTPGGSANPAASQMTVNSTGAFSQTFTKQIGVTATTANSCINACSGTIGGQFYGPGGSHIGLGFNMLDAGPAGSAGVSGIAIFAKAP